MIVQESTARVTITSSQLGVFLYDYKLKSTMAGNEKPLHFKVGLGDKQTNSFRFINYCKTKTTYECRIDNPDFTVDKSVTSPAGKIIY